MHVLLCFVRSNEKHLSPCQKHFQRDFHQSLFVCNIYLSTTSFPYSFFFVQMQKIRHSLIVRVNNISALIRHKEPYRIHKTFLQWYYPLELDREDSLVLNILEEQLAIRSTAELVLPFIICRESEIKSRLIRKESRDGRFGDPHRLPLS